MRAAIFLGAPGFKEWNSLTLSRACARFLLGSQVSYPLHSLSSELGT